MMGDWVGVEWDDFCMTVTRRWRMDRLDVWVSCYLFSLECRS